MKINLPFKKQPDQNNKSKKESQKTSEAQKLDSDKQSFSKGLVSIQDIIAPESIDVDFNFVKVGSSYITSLFVAGYPRFVNANWLSPLINFNNSLSLSMFVYPVEGKTIMDDLRRKITEMEAEIQSDLSRGRIANIDTQVKLEDARILQEQLAKGAERFFQFGLYITISADSEEKLRAISEQVQSTLGSLLIISKKATLQMEEGLKTSLPLGTDYLDITRNMDTTSLATTFPFTSSELTSDRGVLYGINQHNDSLVIFDRFSMENANMVVFAKSGAGKSYTIKLEALRSLMFDSEVIIIDPEGEYEEMSKSVNGEYIHFSFRSDEKINPFDLSAMHDPEENELGRKILTLHTLFKIMLGELSPVEDAVLDRALVAAYKAKGITPDPATQSKEPPLMEDLYKALLGMESKEAQVLASRLEKYIKGSFRGIFDQKSTIDLNNQFTVFGIRELEGSLRPIAMFIILDYIWTKVKQNLKKRLLIVDEAWYLMQYPDSANYMFSLAKRARKYYLGVTTITQDVEDFLSTDQGKAIVTNSSIQLLMKQSTAAIEKLGKIFHLSQGESRFLLSCGVGEGLFFAGQNHVAIRVLASPQEHEVITTNPKEVAEKRKTKKQQEILKTENLPLNEKQNPQGSGEITPNQ
ncbi:VirB4-like conjugal transfer ATPase, CD1110 family [Patescibacteria group bacterium]